MIHYLKEYVTLSEYAGLCGVKNQTIMDRIRRKNIIGYKLGGYVLINILTFPPMQSFRGKYKLLGSSIPDKFKYQPGETMMLTPPPFANLKTVGQVATKEGMRSESIYDRILTGVIDAYVMGGTTFIDITKYPPRSLRLKAKRVRKY